MLPEKAKCLQTKSTAHIAKERRHCSTAPILVVVRSICRSAAARLLGSQVRIPLKAQMFFSFVYSALLRYLPYWVYVRIIVCVCGLQTSTLRQHRAQLGCIATEFGVTWYSNCIRYWTANTNDSTVSIMCVTPQATASGHRSTTIVWWNTTVHVSKITFAESPSSDGKTLSNTICLIGVYRRWLLELGILAQSLVAHGQWWKHIQTRYDQRYRPFIDTRYSKQSVFICRGYYLLVWSLFPWKSN